MKMKSSKIIALKENVRGVFFGLNLFLATITGYLPSHTVRFLLYRYVFNVDIPKDSIIYWRCRFFNPAGVHIGNHSIVGNDAFLDGRCGLYIGNNVNIAAEIRIYTLQHDPESPTFESVGGPVHIEDWVYVGSRVTVLPNVRVGEGAAIASGAVVTKNVEPYTAVGGVPARFIKNRPEVEYVLDTTRPTSFQ